MGDRIEPTGSTGVALQAACWFDSRLGSAGLLEGVTVSSADGAFWRLARASNSVNSARWTEWLAIRPPTWVGRKVRRKVWSEVVPRWCIVGGLAIVSGPVELA
jgi:hypothetical protein